PRQTALRMLLTWIRLLPLLTRTVSRDLASVSPMLHLHAPSPSLMLQPGAALVKDGLAGAGAHATDAEGPHGQQPVEGAHTAGRLDADGRGRAAAHRARVVAHGAALAVAGGRLDEIRPDFTTDPAQLLLVLVCQEAVLEDHLDQRLPPVG